MGKNRGGALEEHLTPAGKSRSRVKAWFRSWLAADKAASALSLSFAVAPPEAPRSRRPLVSGQAGPFRLALGYAKRVLGCGGGGSGRGIASLLLARALVLLVSAGGGLAGRTAESRNGCLLLFVPLLINTWAVDRSSLSDV
jgi:hypothetical protein